MKELINTPSLQERLIEKSQERLVNFTWPRASRELKEVFNVK